MSTSAISPVSSTDYASPGATASQQSVLNNVLSELEQSIGSGDLTGAQTYLTAFEALSPSSASGSNALGSFLTGVATALQDGSAAEAQSALSTYQSATQNAAASTAPSTASSGSAASIAGGLVLSQIQLNLVSSLLGTGSSDASTSSDSSSGSLDSLLNILNAAYGSRSDSPADAAGSTIGATDSANPSSSSSTAASSPYDTLVSAIQASLASGTDPASVALAYLNPNGNYVNTTA